MAKGDYTDSTTKARYRALVKKPASTPTKVTISSDELRTRAEILDMVEELFESEKDVGGANELNPQIDNESLRAFLHMLAKNVVNTSDDGAGITTAQASAITANTAKTGISTSQASAITANTAKRDARMIYMPLVCNMLNADCTNAQYVPFSDGITEGTSSTNPRNVFIAPGNGSIKSINIVSQNSLLEKGSGQPLVATFSKRANGSSTLTPCALLSMTTVAGNNLMSGDFVAIPKSGTLAFSKGEQLLVSLQLTNRLPAGVKNYYVTVVFQLDQSNVD
tara:strand:+ start:207 stop:1043 length:837 start_codon:yes stop_codon:yes gene_type:complete